MTNGMKSSEFIITILSLFIGASMAFYGQGEFIGATMMVASIYVGGRSAVKSFKGGNNV